MPLDPTVGSCPPLGNSYGVMNKSDSSPGVQSASIARSGTSRGSWSEVVGKGGCRYLGKSSGCRAQNDSSSKAAGSDRQSLMAEPVKCHAGLGNLEIVRTSRNPKVEFKVRQDSVSRWSVLGSARGTERDKGPDSRWPRSSLAQ